MAELLIVDDDDALRSWAGRILSAQGYICESAPDAVSARSAIAAGNFKLALLDVNMPGESGIELLSFLRVEHPTVAILIVTGTDDFTLATTAIAQGAYGYLVKPVRAGELLINVANALHRRRSEAAVRHRLAQLERESRYTVEDLRAALAAAGTGLNLEEVFQSEAMHRLVRLAEFRDDQTGQHLIRMSRYCELIALRLGLPPDECAHIRAASELHDIGKVAIADSILLKPGKLTAEEFEVMKTHTVLGHELLADSPSPLMNMAATIALTHHERWDGSGYPNALAGAEIPLEGRIAAAADVFDALTSDRVYRPAFPSGSRWR